MHLEQSQKSRQDARYAGSSDSTKARNASEESGPDMRNATNSPQSSRDVPPQVARRLNSAEFAKGATRRNAAATRNDVRGGTPYTPPIESVHAAMPNGIEQTAAVVTTKPIVVA